MKLNTISTVLAYLLAGGHWSLLVPVRADDADPTGATALKLFKDDGSGNPVEMAAADFTKKKVVGNDKYEFVSGVKCVSVKIGEAELWKKGDQAVNEPRYVTYNDTLKKVVVCGSKTLTYKKDSTTNEWKFVDPTAKTASGTGVTPPKAESASPGSSSVPAHGASSSAAPKAGADKEPEKKADNTQATPSDLKLFKDDGSGNGVAMAENTDYEKKTDNDVVTYKFNKGVKCTLVKVDDKDVWKKGDNGVNEPELVTFNDTTKRVVLLDNAKSVTYKKGADGNWKHLMTINRPKTANSAKTGDSSQAAPAPGSDSSSVASPEAKVETDSTSTASPETATSE
ncbi:hypothetical protein MACJ_002388 [Theileria orientalis]|uniref:Uncharacterized protein n=1 Tax=Theileria orientalis TaxID=68886 RepID=A0A976M624_THEOR|nr:hypothetical protein MACJ_002388 [Theileria orientalis]